MLNVFLSLVIGTLFAMFFFFLWLGMIMSATAKTNEEGHVILMKLAKLAFASLITSGVLLGLCWSLGLWVPTLHGVDLWTPTNVWVKH